VKKIKCRHCKSEAVSCDFKGKKNKKNLLFQCQNQKCKKFFWHGRVKNEFNLKEKPDSAKNILIEKNLMKSLSIPLRVKGRYVYVLALSKQKDEKTESLYVGQTGRHPLQRYLQHLRKYKSGRGISNRLKYLKDYYSGFTTEEDSLNGEKVISKKLMKSYKVYGDGTK
tara:strand:+ start:312 stop:815 length:504 start_codon:yes stop_codon:yes gene_type:complete